MSQEPYDGGIYIFPFWEEETECGSWRVSAKSTLGGIPCNWGSPLVLSLCLRQWLSSVDAPPSFPSLWEPLDFSLWTEGCRVAGLSANRTLLLVDRVVECKFRLEKCLESCSLEAICNLPAVWPWVSHLPSLCPSFLAIKCVWRLKALRTAAPSIE